MTDRKIPSRGQTATFSVNGVKRGDGMLLLYPDELIVVRDGRVIVQIRSRWAVPAPELAAVITAMLAPLTGNRPVDVVIADIDDPPGAPAPSAPAGAAPSRPARDCRRLEQPGAPGFSPYGCE
jgi:hypothetical protein